MLEKTAEHVALNGSDFEKILVQREQFKPEFAFLKIDSPYRPYYDHQVAKTSKKLLENLAQEEENQQPKIEEEIVQATKQKEQAEQVE